MAEKKQQVRLVFKLAAFGGFIMLGYLGIRSYRLSVEKLKINACIEEISELSQNIQERFMNQHYYGEIDYNTVDKMSLFPKRMFKPGYREALNAYGGGVDIFYSPLYEGDKYNGFEISFQGISNMACRELIKSQINASSLNNVVAVAGYGIPTPSGVLDEVYVNTPQNKITNHNIFKSETISMLTEEKLNNACTCKELTCSVVWKFR